MCRSTRRISSGSNLSLQAVFNGFFGAEDFRRKGKGGGALRTDSMSSLSRDVSGFRCFLGNKNTKCIIAQTTGSEFSTSKESWRRLPLHLQPHSSKTVCEKASSDRFGLFAKHGRRVQIAGIALQDLRKRFPSLPTCTVFLLRQ